MNQALNFPNPPVHHGNLLNGNLPPLNTIVEDEHFTESTIKLCYPSTFESIKKHGIDVHLRDQYQNTLLHLSHDDRIIQLLLQSNADPNAYNSYGHTPLQYARSKDIVSLLLDAKADPHPIGLNNHVLNSFLSELNIVSSYPSCKSIERNDTDLSIFPAPYTLVPAHWSPNVPHHAHTRQPPSPISIPGQQGVKRDSYGNIVSVSSKDTIITQLQGTFLLSSTLSPQLMALKQRIMLQSTSLPLTTTVSSSSSLPSPPSSSLPCPSPRPSPPLHNRARLQDTCKITDERMESLIDTIFSSLGPKTPDSSFSPPQTRQPSPTVQAFPLPSRPFRGLTNTNQPSVMSDSVTIVQEDDSHVEPECPSSMSDNHYISSQHRIILSPSSPSSPTTTRAVHSSFDVYPELVDTTTTHARNLTNDNADQQCIHSLSSITEDGYEDDSDNDNDNDDSFDIDHFKQKSSKQKPNDNQLSSTLSPFPPFHHTILATPVLPSQRSPIKQYKSPSKHKYKQPPPSSFLPSRQQQSVQYNYMPLTHNINQSDVHGKYINHSTSIMHPYITQLLSTLLSETLGHRTGQRQANIPSSSPMHSSLDTYRYHNMALLFAFCLESPMMRRNMILYYINPPPSSSSSSLITSSLSHPYTLSLSSCTSHNIMSGDSTTPLTTDIVPPVYIPPYSQISTDNIILYTLSLFSFQHQSWRYPSHEIRDCIIPHHQSPMGHILSGLLLDMLPMIFQSINYQYPPPPPSPISPTSLRHRYNTLYYHHIRRYNNDDILSIPLNILEYYVIHIYDEYCIPSMSLSLSPSLSSSSTSVSTSQQQLSNLFTYDGITLCIYTMIQYGSIFNDHIRIILPSSKKTSQMWDMIRDCMGY